MASSIKLCPSTVNPFIATNKYPSFTSFELFAIPFISVSKFPFTFKFSNPTNIHKEQIFAFYRLHYITILFICIGFF